MIDFILQMTKHSITKHPQLNSLGFDATLFLCSSMMLFELCFCQAQHIHATYITLTFLGNTNSSTTTPCGFGVLASHSQSPVVAKTSMIPETIHTKHCSYIIGYIAFLPHHKHVSTQASLNLSQFQYVQLILIPIKKVKNRQCSKITSNSNGLNALN